MSFGPYKQFWGWMFKLKSFIYENMCEKVSLLNISCIEVFDLVTSRKCRSALMWHESSHCRARKCSIFEAIICIILAKDIVGPFAFVLSASPFWCRHARFWLYCSGVKIQENGLNKLKPPKQEQKAVFVFWVRRYTVDAIVSRDGVELYDQHIEVWR